MAEFFQGVFFDLADSFSADTEAVADVLIRGRLGVVEAEVEIEDVLIAFG
jgi:hypothetical protein